MDPIKEALQNVKDKKYDEAWEVLSPYENAEKMAELNLSKKKQADVYMALATIYNNKEKNDENLANYKKFLQLSLEHGNIEALMEYTSINDTTLTIEELRMLEHHFKSHENEEQNSQFYAEYGRILYIIKKRNEECDVKKIKDLYEKSLQKNKKQTAAYLYLARYYNKNYENLDATEALLKAEEYFNLAIENGSYMAQQEYNTFRKKQMPEISFDLMNASENLENFIQMITSPIKSYDFSLFVSGPVGCGKEVFAQKLMDALSCNYHIISLRDVYDSKINWTLLGEKTGHYIFDKKTNALDEYKKLNYKTLNYERPSLSKDNKFSIERDNQRIPKFTNFSFPAISVFLEKGDRSGVIFQNLDPYFATMGFYTNNISNKKNVETILAYLKENTMPFIFICENKENFSQDFMNAFTFRIDFSYMDASQKEAAYKLFFNYDAPQYLRRLGGLVVEDFSRIKKKAKIMNILSDSDKILNLLEDEAKFKAGGSNDYLKPDTSFSFDLVNTDINLPELTDKLTENKTLNFSMLIYGPSGTGKSYYLRYLADKIGVNTMERTAADLLSKWHAESVHNIRNMFREATEKKSMIIIDEVEMLIQDRGNDNNNRNDVVNAFLTEMESFKYPFVCTTNFLEKIDKAVLRRFVFKTKFDFLTKEQNIIAFKHFFKLDPPEELNKIGGLTNGDYSTVKKKAIILDVVNNVDELIAMLKEESTRKTKSIIVQDINIQDFDKKFLNTDIDVLEGFLKNIKKDNKTHFSFLLHGPSGTGKSMYLRHIASELGYEVIERRGSDIVSKWHGETSVNIAKAFEEAKERKAFLIFDEIDGILYRKDRIGDHLWMGEQINEFLIQMENHPYPFAGTTNYLDNIEPAALRRFSIKALFDYLKPEQYDYIYEKTFGFKPIEDISYLKWLTPAVFKNAHNKADLAEALSDEKKVFDVFVEEAKIAGNKIKGEKQIETFDNLEIEAVPLYTKPIAENYPDILKGTVKVWGEDGSHHGSGFFITKNGFILTNKHVVKDSKTMIIELFSGRQVPAEVLRTNDLDVALLKISDENLCTPMPIRLEEPNPGTTIFSMGNPDDKDQVLSRGSITRYTQIEKGRRIEGDNFSYGGVSGGPLMDEFGNVLGLNVEHWTDREFGSKGRLGLALQVPIIDALEVLNITIKEKKKK